MCRRREGVVDQSFFSQWFPATFRVDGHEFGSAEQYMMWRKARLFEDDASAAAVLNARSAAHAKAIGRARPRGSTSTLGSSIAGRSSSRRQRQSSARTRRLAEVLGA